MKLTRITSSKPWHAGAAIFYIGLTLWIASTVWENFGPKPETPRTTTDFFGLCRYTILMELESPDKEKVATLGVHDCGGTTSWQTGVSVHNRKIKETYRGLLLLQGRPENYSISWENGYTVVATGFAIEDVLALRREDLAGAKVVLRPNASDDTKHQTSDAR